MCVHLTTAAGSHTLTSLKDTEAHCLGFQPENGSPLHELHNALRVHEEDFTLRFAVQGGCVAIQDVGNLKESKPVTVPLLGGLSG